MYRLELIDGRNVTYKDALDMSRVKVCALAEDIVQQELIPHHQRIDSKVRPPIAEFEKLYAHLSKISNRISRASHASHISLLSDPKLRDYVLKNENGEILGVAEWKLPEYVDNPFEVTWLRKIYVAWLRVLYAVIDFFRPSFQVEPILEEYHAVAAEHGLMPSDLDEAIAQLQQKSRKELEETVYPEQLGYHLRIFGVRPDYHGSGLGRRLLADCFSALKSEAVPPPMIDGPAKLQWQAAPNARNFYRKVGCTEAAVSTSKRGHEHATFFVNVE